MNLRILIALMPCLTFGQTAVAFEAASVKAAAPGTNREILQGGPGTGDPGQISYRGISLSRLILRAYSAKAYQLSGPDWMRTAHFDIVAKIPGDATKQQVNLMLQNLLAQRFSLQLHHESKELMGYELQIANDGPKLKAAAATPYVPDPNAGPLIYLDRTTHNERYRLNNGLARTAGQMQTIADMVTLCEGETRLPVVDKTALTGEYDYSIDYAPDTPAKPADDTLAATAMVPGPNFESALQKQLGLKLEKKKVPIDMLVVDHADKTPVEN